MTLRWDGTDQAHRADPLQMPETAGDVTLPDPDMALMEPSWPDTSSRGAAIALVAGIVGIVVLVAVLAKAAGG